SSDYSALSDIYDIANKPMPEGQNDIEDEVIGEDENEDEDGLENVEDEGEDEEDEEDEEEVAEGLDDCEDIVVLEDPGGAPRMVWILLQRSSVECFWASLGNLSNRQDPRGDPDCDIP
ncbi:hypothetical protein BGZ83_007117, partial [Gryganskiella cystojenkinii]